MSNLTQDIFFNMVNEFKTKFPPMPKIIYSPKIRIKFLKKSRYGNNLCFNLRIKFIKKYKTKFHDRAIYFKNEGVIVVPAWFKEQQIEMLKNKSEEQVKGLLMAAYNPGA